MNDPAHDDDDGPRTSLPLVASIVYGLFVVAAVLWLYLRDRAHVLPGLAFGDSSAWQSLSVGAVAGFALSGVLAVLGRHLAVFRRLEKRLEETVGPLTEPEMILIAMSSAIGEEIFFRGALQDFVQNPFLCAAVFGLLHIGPGLWLWGLSAAILGLCFSLMVDAGFGLLSVTVAHALINFIALRRMSSS